MSDQLLVAILAGFYSAGLGVGILMGLLLASMIGRTKKEDR